MEILVGVLGGSAVAIAIILALTNRKQVAMAERGQLAVEGADKLRKEIQTVTGERNANAVALAGMTDERDRYKALYEAEARAHAAKNEEASDAIVEHGASGSVDDVIADARRVSTGTVSDDTTDPR